jgi:HTH-type transcriptional regulator / antitoxin HipB
MPIHTVEELGAAIRHRRRQLNWDQQSLAERVGVSRQWIVEIEAGKLRAEIGLLLRTLSALDLQLEISSQHENTAPPVEGRHRRLDLDFDIDAVVERARGLRR